MRRSIRGSTRSRATARGRRSDGPATHVPRRSALSSHPSGASTTPRRLNRRRRSPRQRGGRRGRGRPRRRASVRRVRRRPVAGATEPAVRTTINVTIVRGNLRKRTSAHLSSSGFLARKRLARSLSSRPEEVAGLTLDRSGRQRLARQSRIGVASSERGSPLRRDSSTKSGGRGTDSTHSKSLSNENSNVNSCIYTLLQVRKR